MNVSNIIRAALKALHHIAHFFGHKDYISLGISFAYFDFLGVSTQVVTRPDPGQLPSPDKITPMLPLAEFKIIDFVGNIIQWLK